MKKRLLQLSPGPVFNLNIEQRQEMTKFFDGAIITSSPDENIYKRKDVCGFQFCCMKNSRSSKLLSNIKFLFYCIKFCFIQRIKGIQYDFVTTYDPLKTGLLGVMVSFLLGTKLIVEVNGVYTSPAEYMDSGNGLSIKIKMKLFPIIERFVLKHADGIKTLFPTQLDPFEDVLAGKLISSFFAFVPIDNFIDQDVEEEHVVLFVGFPFWRKGVDILIDAFKELSHEYPDWKLKILGWFEPDEELLNYIGDHPQIFHHPPVYYKDMPEHITSSSIVVLPSRSEAMGRVLLEAMAARKPRIGARIDGIPMVIKDGHDGLLFEPLNIGDLAKKLRMLMGDAKLRKKFGDAGYERVTKEMTKEEYFKKLFAFYDRVLQK